MKKILILSLLCSSLSSVALAERSVEPKENIRIEYLQTGRYSMIKNAPPVDQLNPLKVVIKTRIPQSVDTVRGTIEYLLIRSGYSLADESVMSREAITLLQMPLPSVQRELGPMTLDMALHTLSGTAYELVVDPVHRKVTFELTTKLARIE